jgi:WD repeat-containing protein 1 (actin-interacting protein 1)
MLHQAVSIIKKNCHQHFARYLFTHIPQSSPTPPPLIDISGRVRVWAWTNEGHTLKYECQALGGEVEDVAWDGESKRILAVGGGATNAKVFAWDTGSNLAEIVPHSKKVITCDVRPTKPTKLAYGGEDFKMSFYAGPPFKFAAALKEHSNFVNCVRYSPDGVRFASFSADKSCIIYDGETAAVIGKLEAVHGGGVYAGAWSPDGTKIATACGDKAVRVFNMSSPTGPWTVEATFIFGTRPDDMQHSITWHRGDVIVSTSLEGTLNIFDAANVNAGPTKRVYGHREPVSHIAFESATGVLFTGCAGGRVCKWTPLDENRTRYEASLTTGSLPTKKIAAIATRDGILVAASWDDQVRIGDAATGLFSTSTPLGGQPKGLVILADGAVVVATGGSILLVAKSGAVISTLAVAWGPTCVDASTDGAVIAVGGNDKKVHIFTRSASGTLVEAGVTKEAAAAVSVVAVEPNGVRVAAGDAGREIRLYKVPRVDGVAETLISGRWMAHTTRVTGLKWSPTGTWLASVSIDRRLAIWDPASDSPKLTIDLAHSQPFAGVVWASENELWTLGTDGVAVKKKIAL